MKDWFEIVNMRIQCRSRRSVFMTLNDDCEPVHICITSSTRLWLGRPISCSGGIQQTFPA